MLEIMDKMKRQNNHLSAHNFGFFKSFRKESAISVFAWSQSLGMMDVDVVLRPGGSSPGSSAILFSTIATSPFATTIGWRGDEFNPNSQ